ncbi:PSD1 and planctomycete cytochrome C domain-containing protein [Bythopirellula goksoeyrii]|nr:PSD1 and planctomycete cytochrome C domain-containing protein [Bythopirellula goksoeyrii]
MRILTFLLILLSSQAPSGALVALDFNRDVRPILSENCFACHGFDEGAREADLRLDEAGSALKDRGGYAAIVPRNLEASELWRRINSEDEDEMMPPPDSRRELTLEQKKTLRLWIEQGAPYAKHWSFISPEKSPIPKVADESWPRNEIDLFVAARLEEEKIVPLQEADRRTLIRRLSLDLTGLPPSAEEVEAFALDDESQAYERLVDRLLASPHFGERMALEWLDAARYADTNGYSIDGGRHLWLWRDWVINAFNENLPYDQFLVDQIAGDLMTDPTESQLIATGFQRNNMVTHEGGTIPEENITNYNADRLKTLGEAVLGLTLGCAQCHDHKYDPITQRDYYRLFAYFNTLGDVGLDGDRGVNARPTFETRTVLPTGELPALKARIDEINNELNSPNPVEVTEWEQRQKELLSERGRDFAMHSAKLLEISTPNQGAGFEIEENHYVKITNAPKFVAYEVSMQLPHVDRKVTGIRIVFHPDALAPGEGWGYGKLDTNESGEDSNGPEKGTFVLTALAASAGSVPGDQLDLHHILGVSSVTANSWREDYLPGNVLDARRNNGWSPKLAHKGPVHITLNLEKPFDATQMSYLTMHVNFGQSVKLVAAKFEFYALTGNDDDSELPEEVIEIIETPKDNRSSEQIERLRHYFASHSDTMLPLRIELANLEERVSVLTQKFPTMVMDEADEPRETHILNRGSYASPGERVTPGIPEALPKPPAGVSANRLGLARWLTMPTNPLTARVAVNRIWQMLFGTGIVRTAADFGAQGAWPTHPELLDWLAVDFVEDGWDIKALVRKIVTSATYRRTSATGQTSKLLEIDPDNELLARGPRFRLPAEFIRDSALKISGLLVPRIGGPSVNPYTPGDLWREVSHYGSTGATAQTFVQDHGEKLYRRSLYTYWKRTVPPPNMAAFDAPTRETCTIQRLSTTTPLQALVLLNDTQFVEAARNFAERIIAHGNKDSDRARWAFEECVSRTPTVEELEVLANALDRERRRYSDDQTAAEEFLANGESPRNEQIPPGEHAAWSQVAALLMNLSETVTCN